MERAELQNDEQPEPNVRAKRARMRYTRQRRVVAGLFELKLWLKQTTRNKRGGVAAYSASRGIAKPRQSTNGASWEAVEPFSPLCSSERALVCTAELRPARVGFARVKLGRTCEETLTVGEEEGRREAVAGTGYSSICREDWPVSDRKDNGGDNASVGNMHGQVIGIALGPGVVQSASESEQYQPQYSQW